MSILEILEAHTLAYDWYPCSCGVKWVWDGRSSGTEQHRAHVAQVLEQHVWEREAAAVRGAGQYIQLLHRGGLVDRKAVLADLEIAADRIERGLHANGRDGKIA